MRCRLAIAVAGLMLATAPFAWAGQTPAPATQAPAMQAPAAAKAKKAPNAQQEKMAACSKDAASHQLKGTERKSFMKECLSSDAETATKKLTAQQEKMKTCNADAAAKKLTGAARKTFMSDCLKKS